MVADGRTRGERAEVAGAARRRVPAWAWLVLALGLSLLLRVPFLGLPLISDEGGYAYVTERWLAGEGRLYHDLWVSRPQGIFLAYAAILETLGRDAVALRLGAWVWSAATLLVVWRFAGRWRGPGAAALAALFLAALGASPAIEGFTANAEVFMALPAAGAALLLLRAARAGSDVSLRGCSRGCWGGWWLLAAGVCAGLATLLKPSGVVMLGVGLAFVWLTAADPRSALRRTGWIAAGFTVALAPALVHGWWVGWDEFVYASLTYRLTSQSGATAGLRHQAVSVFALLGRCWPLLVLTGAVLLAGRGGWPLPVAWRAGFGRALARATQLGVVAPWPAPGGWRGDAGTLLLRLWLLASLAGVAVGGDWWAHYLIQPAAPFAVWLAGLLVRAWPRLDAAAHRGLVALALVAFLSPFAVVARGDADAMSRAIFGQRHYPDQDEVAAYLREHTPPDASIFVAFDHPAIYHLADRRAAYRHLYDAELQAIPGSYGELLALIEGPDRPRYVAVTTEHGPFPDKGQAFLEAVLPRYHLVDTVQGVPIFRADDGLGRNR